MTTTRRFEKVALDKMHENETNCSILVSVDYFSRFVKLAILPSRCSSSIIRALEVMYKECGLPETFVTDNAKEFTSQEFTKWCIDRNLSYIRVGVESHRSNGRVERIIGTLREYLLKYNEGSIALRVPYIADVYNATYHSGIKCP